MNEDGRRDWCPAHRGPWNGHPYPCWCEDGSRKEPSSTLWRHGAEPGSGWDVEAEVH